ncbi:MAG: ABC transporter permease [Candidatus Tectomicrobia bacterium]|nr:ABC transporter permease [Candidatus Tectomicrobia bacterium]
MQTPQGEVFLTALVFVAFLFLWWAYVRILDLSNLVLPGPLTVWRSLLENVSSGLLLVHLWVTLSEILLGFLAGSVLGISLGTVIAHSQLARKILNPYILASQAMPKLALAPIFVVWFGYGLLPKIVITALICFFPLLENTIIGLTEVSPHQIELFRALTASRWQTFYKLRVPNALPVIFAGLRVAITLAVVGAVVGEYVGANRGLGALIIATQGNFDTPLMFAVFVVLTVVGVVLYKGMQCLEKTFFAWRYLKRGD